MKYDFNVRAFEIHSLYAWDFEWIIKSMDFMTANGFNTLILHRNDFIDLIVYPGKYFGCKKNHYNSIFERYKEIFRTLYKFTPTRRSGPYQRRAFLKRVLLEAERRGINVYIENKELYFPDIILEFYPELVKNGKICATDPFWIEFTKVKYREFFEEFPEVSGIITSPATGESRVSINSNRCSCDRCKNTSKAEWFRNVLMAMYEPIHAAGKRLVVRDFVFNPDAHRDISEAMESLPSDVVLSLKNTPHDYYPTFPINPRIGNVGKHEQWIEFDAMGQYFGWGVCIADLMEDYRLRMKDALSKGASGVVFRTDWESLDGHTAFGNMNRINLYSAGMLSRDTDVSSESIYDAFLSAEGWYPAETTLDQRKRIVQWFSGVMSQTWNIASKTMFVKSCVFSDSSLVPISFAHALWLSEEKNSLKDWQKEKATALLAIPEEYSEIINEKEQALNDASAIVSEVSANNPGLRKEKYDYLVSCFENQFLYVRLFRNAAEAIFSCRYIKEGDKKQNAEMYKRSRDIFQSSMKELSAMSVELDSFWKNTEYRPHIIYTLLDPDRIRCLYDDLKEVVDDESLF